MPLLSYFFALLLMMLSISVFAQKSKKQKVRVGVWEFFDAQTFPDSCLLVNKKEIYGNSIDDDKNGYVDDYYGIGFDYKEQATNHNFTPKYENNLDEYLYFHGTAVTDVILKYNANVQVLGVGFIRYVERKFSEEMLANFKDRMQNMTEDAKLIKQMLEEGAKYFHDNKVKVVNISWGGDPPVFKRIFSEYGIDTTSRNKEIFDWIQAFEDCLRGIFLKYPDIMFVIGAGNDNDDVIKRKNVPANIELPNVITVGGKMKSGEKCSFSNYGKNVRVYAPCADAMRISSVNKKTYYLEGTSFSAPVITAWVALQLQKGLSFRQIKKKAEKIGFIHKDNFQE